MYIYIICHRPKDSKGLRHISIDASSPTSELDSEGEVLWIALIDVPDTNPCWMCSSIRWSIQFSNRKHMLIAGGSRNSELLKFRNDLACIMHRNWYVLRVSSTERTLKEYHVLKTTRSGSRSFRFWNRGVGIHTHYLELRTDHNSTQKYSATWLILIHNKTQALFP